MCASPTSLAATALLLCAAAGAAHAQLVIGDSAVHERLEVTVREDGSAHVLHEIKRSPTPVTVLSVDGNYSNVRMASVGGGEVEHPISRHEGGFGVTVPASESNTAVEYDLAGAVSDVGEYRTWEYSYPAETLFVLPMKVGRVHVNGAAVDIEGGRFLCHGCFALIEYSPDERIYSYGLGGGSPASRMEIQTAVEIAGAGIDTGVGVISAEIVADGRAFVEVAVPKALLAGPYEAYLDGERIRASVASENATHARLQAPVGAGTLNVFGEGGGGGDGAGVSGVGLAAIIAGAAGAAAALALWARGRGRAR